MKKLTLSIVLAFAGFAQALECDVLQVISTDTLTNAQRLGNGFAYSSQIVVVNDHSLAPDAKNAILKQGNKTWAAQIIKRDFHTDLAVLQVPRGSFSRCELSSQLEDKATVIGYDRKDSSLSKIPVHIKTAESSKLMVPGFRKSVEFIAEGKSELQSSQSGSVLVTSAGKVAGLVTQKTSIGSALAIKSTDVDHTVRAILENRLPERGYEVDRRKEIFRFKGLKFEKQGTGGVDPHGHKVDPHGSPLENPISSDTKAPQPIALEDYEVGAVLATVEDFSLLYNSQPKLAQALREARVNRVFIASVDGKPVRNLLDLLRVLGECTTCQVDSFWIEVKDPAQVQDSTLRLMGWLSALIVELEKSNKREEVAEVVKSIQQMNPLLVQLLNDSQGKRMDLGLKKLVRDHWNEVDSKLDRLWHSDKTLDILTEIRAEIL